MGNNGLIDSKPGSALHAALADQSNHRLQCPAAAPVAKKFRMTVAIASQC